MKYYDYDMDGFKLHVIKTNRFKTVFYSINIRFEDNKDSEIYTSLLSRMLIQTSSKFNSLREINTYCASIYDPSYNIRVLGSGSENILRLTSSFANEKYTEKGMLLKNLEFLTSFIFEPKIVDGGFDKEMFDIQKDKLLEYYKSMKDNPKEYAKGRLAEEMQIKKYKVLKLDDLISGISNLSEVELYNFYQSIMSKGCLDIFICGDVDEKEVKEIFSKLIKFKGTHKKINHLVKQHDFKDMPKIVVDKTNNTQSNLIIGFKLDNLSDFERNYVFVLYSWILGGGMSSLLSQTVREKYSLCYYIYAVRQNLFETMKIYAGIDGVNFEKTCNLIQDELENMENGNFSLELFEGVKEIYYNSLIRIEDSQDDLVASYVSEIFINNDSISDRKKNMSKVTKEDVMNLAKKVHVDTIYLLKGEV